MAAAASTSMAAAAVLMHRLPAAKFAAVFSPLPNRQYSSSPQFRQLKETTRRSRLLVKASSSDEAPDTFTDLKEKWDAIENKSTVLTYGGGAIVAIWLASVVVGAVNSVPLLPKILELVGLGYTAWFVYRYLLFKSSRKELVEDIEELKKKIAGTE
ncbi:CURVATURE THYLAKOID 1A-like protein [Perilla frutescens var. hirtella]|uniref:CURVATURE THYLAKOID 1A-like protein n=1 Tax=Perilla frutescens var. hirtella TaxID=608512 RepID=A0AAD4PED0_PERFH|nr:CURVATURE THYLAKOID 1A-like protein [Perilla frutescens var. frutescens]KAH6814444.1 CURVATURE THYLAKOID 1A-like protein [Perilla frutescens var. frutescens]KAH6836843.1 CURVATURE THYLAKOID 1A-like protein [Perilla frutescens var. hirtella]